MPYIRKSTVDLSEHPAVVPAYMLSARQISAAKGWARTFAAVCVASQVLYGVVVIGKYGKDM